MPSVPDLFLDTHTRLRDDGERLFLKKKDKVIYDAYQDAHQSNPDKNENELWFETVKGYKKGSVYGAGNAHDLFYQTPSRRQSSSLKETYVPGIVTQLQGQLDAQRASNEARDEEMRRANAARDEQIAKMQAELERMQSMFQFCNPGIRPPFPDPRDPHGGVVVEPG